LQDTAYTAFVQVEQVYIIADHNGANTEMDRSLAAAERGQSDNSGGVLTVSKAKLHRSKWAWSVWLLHLQHLTA
jgi:hypothetical protein